mgnify:FL=1
MKSRLTAILAILIIMILAAHAQAADKILSTTVDSATTALDKNGNEYVRMIVSEPRTLSGVKYTTSVAVMAFGDQVAPAKAIAAGDNIKAIVSSREYQGRTSYTVISFIE